MYNLLKFAARFDFEIIDVFRIITPLYTPRIADFLFISKELRNYRFVQNGPKKILLYYSGSNMIKRSFLFESLSFLYLCHTMPPI